MRPRSVLFCLSLALNACPGEPGSSTGTGGPTSSSTGEATTTATTGTGTTTSTTSPTTTGGTSGTSGTGTTGATEASTAEASTAVATTGASSTGPTMDAGVMPDMTCGACGMPRGAPIGGGAGYPWIEEPAAADHLVATRDELLAALAAAQAGEVIYIDDAAEIDLSDTWDIFVPGGVTLASGRGRDGSPGALLYNATLVLSPVYDDHMLLRTAGPDVRFTGFRLRGSDTEIQAEPDSYDNYMGITIEHDDCEIDNMEIWGWSYWATGVFGAQGGDIHHNNIHHNRRDGLGYGVEVGNTAFALIEGNLFDANRHSIAGNGGAGPSYEARYNVVGPTANGHAFDMHVKNGFAGDEIRIHHNTFQLTNRRAVFILGVPATGAWIDHNSLAHPEGSDAILQNADPPQNWYVADNCFDTPVAICE